MNGMMLLCVALGYFALCYWLYGGFLTRLFGIDNSRQTPAVTRYDGIDYVPSHPAVLFGHHFSSIAGAGPIVGPIMASYFGWLPALLWILIGCVFVGAVHDFAALFLSVRNGGKSIGYVIEKLMGLGGRQLFLVFCWACLILVVAIFGLMVAGTFYTNPSVATASILFILMAPIFGFVSRRYLSLRSSSFIFVPLVFFSVWLATKIPADIQTWFNLSDSDTKLVWLSFLAVYVLVASVVPVQWLLQPRDYLSSYLLYAMLLLGIIGIFIYNPEIRMPNFVAYRVPLASGDEANMIPTLFILIACGACSGFHSLVASGTTSKQIRKEKDILPIGYGGMIVEGILGVMSLITVIYLSDADFLTLAKNPAQAFAHGIGTFTECLGLPKDLGIVFISLSISAFMMTSLDTATRLGRFCWQELFSPSYINAEKYSQNNELVKNCSFTKILSNSFVASIIFVILAFIMAKSGSASSVWPIFGASNQLLAALTLLSITLYLKLKGLNYHITLLPTILMVVMSIWGLIEIAIVAWNNSYVLVGSSLFLIFMAILLVILSFVVLKKHLLSKTLNNESV
jgi:carbon starvation protein